MMKNFNKKTGGFALFEVLLATAIFVIIVGGFMWVMKNYSQKNHNTTVAENLSSVMNAAINKAYSYDGYLGLDSKGNTPVPLQRYLNGQISDYMSNNLKSTGYDLNQITVSSDKNGGLLYYVCPPTSLQYVKFANGQIYNPAGNPDGSFSQGGRSYKYFNMQAAYGGVTWKGFYIFTTKTPGKNDWQVPDTLPSSLMAGDAYLPANSNWWNQLNLIVPSQANTFAVCHAFFYFGDTGPDHQGDRATLVLWPDTQQQPDAAQTSCYFTTNPAVKTGGPDINKEITCNSTTTNQQCRLLCQVNPS